MVERLYGVMHGKSLRIAGIPVAEFEVKPGKELVNELLSLPPNTSVGIEHTPELANPFEINGVPITISSGSYWREIERVCKSGHLNIVYLEDFPTYEKYVSKLMEKNRAEKENLRNYRKFHKDNPTKTTAEYEEDKAVRGVLRKAYRAEVEAEYIFVIEREQKMLDKVAETQPQVVILGRGHADFLMLKPNEFTSRNISSGQYKTEERKPIPVFTQSEDFPCEDIVGLIQDPFIDRSGLLNRELLIRRHRAVTKGRVMVRGKPDYIGTWDLTIPARGLFEIYLDKKDGGITGRIEDTLGTATFAGIISEEEVMFSKRYKQTKSSGDAIKEAIIYQGDGNSNGLHVGRFKVSSAYYSDKETPFAMMKFSSSSKLNLS